MALKSNTASIYIDEEALVPLQSGITDFEIFDDEILDIVKVTNKPNNYFFEGDTIIFTITIENTGTKTLEDLVFRDVIDTIVIPNTGTDFIVDSDFGTIESKTRNILITEITLEPDDICTITIEGVIDTL